VVPGDEPDHADRHEAEQERLILEQPEERAAVAGVHQAHEVADDRQALALGRQHRDEPGLRDLVEHEDGGGDPEEQRPTGARASR
jgi:hypothetical protein